MNEALVASALAHATFVVRDERGAPVRSIEGDAIARMVKALERLDELVMVSQRRGLSFPALLAERANDPSGAGHLPSWHLAWPEGNELHFSEHAARAALAAHDLVLDDLVTPEMRVDRRRIASLRELHENKEIERKLADLAELGVDAADWDPVAGQPLASSKSSPSKLSSGAVAGIVVGAVAVFVAGVAAVAVSRKRRAARSVAGLAAARAGAASKTSSSR